jgi:phosphoglycerate dehydrogenase-like enzyme
MKFLFLPPQTEATRGWAGRLRRELPELEVVVAETLAEAQRLITDTDGAFGTLPADLLAHAAKLRWLQAPYAAPPAGYYHQELIEHPVIVTNMRELFNDHVGTHAMAFVLCFARGFQHYIPLQQRRSWSPLAGEGGMVHLPEATALIVGAGGIGAEIGRMLSAFGTRVIGTDARRTSSPPGFAELHPAGALDRLLPRADFVILTVPDTPTTRGFMDRSRFSLMRKDAYFINVGRGKTTRLNDLVAALRAGEIAGAGLDVFEDEPLPTDHPLWTLPNVLLTPHTGWHGPYLDQRRFEVILGNCRALLAQREFVNVVDKSSWF